MYFYKYRSVLQAVTCLPHRGQERARKERRNKKKKRQQCSGVEAKRKMRAMNKSLSANNTGRRTVHAHLCTQLYTAQTCKLLILLFLHLISWPSSPQPLTLCICSLFAVASSSLPHSASNLPLLCHQHRLTQLVLTLRMRTRMPVTLASACCLSN